MLDLLVHVVIIPSSTPMSFEHSSSQLWCLVIFHNHRYFLHTAPSRKQILAFLLLVDSGISFLFFFLFILLNRDCFLCLCIHSSEDWRKCASKTELKPILIAASHGDAHNMCIYIARPVWFVPFIKTKGLSPALWMYYSRMPLLYNSGRELPHWLTLRHPAASSFYPAGNEL